MNGSEDSSDNSPKNLGILNKELDPSVRLQAHYTSLGITLEQCDNLIPKEGLEIWDDSPQRNRTTKIKEFDLTNAAMHIREVFESQFPDIVQQEELVVELITF